MDLSKRVRYNKRLTERERQKSYSRFVMYLQDDLISVSSPLTFASVSGSVHLLEEMGCH